MSACTAADVAPPEDWTSGFHALTLSPAAYGALRLVAALLQRLPHLASAQVLPPLLCDALAALACHPVAAVAAPDLHAYAHQHLPALRPAVVAQLKVAEQLQQQRAGLLAAVQQLAAAPSAALAAASCREVAGQLPALALLAQPELEQAVGATIESAASHGSSPPAGALAAQLLLHPEDSVRAAALQALASAVQRQQIGGQLLLQPAVAGCLVTRLSGSSPEQQQLAAWLLQAAATADSGACGRAFLPWESWLLCHAGSPTAGPAVAAVLQQVAAQKRCAWQHLAPLAQALFHASPAVAADAAAQLHSGLVQLRPAAAGAILFNPLPFDGLLAFAGSGEAAGEALPRARAGARAAARAASAARLFTAADVQSLVAVAASRSLQPGLAAAALGQLAQVAGDERFAPILASEPGGLEQLGQSLGGASDGALFTCMLATSASLGRPATVTHPPTACSPGHAAGARSGRLALPWVPAAGARVPGGAGGAARGRCRLAAGRRRRSRRAAAAAGVPPAAGRTPRRGPPAAPPAVWPGDPAAAHPGGTRCRPHQRQRCSRGQG